MISTVLQQFIVVLAFIFLDMLNWETKGNSPVLFDVLPVNAMLNSLQVSVVNAMLNSLQASIN